MTTDLKLKQRTLSFFGYAGAGVLYVIVATIILSGLAMALTFIDPNSSTDEQGLVTITSLTSAFVNLDFAGIVIGLISFIVLGALVWIFGVVGVMIRRALGSKEDQIKFDKRPAILAFFLAGIIAVVIFATLQAILVGITQDDTVNLTDVMSLFDAIVEQNPMLFIGVLFGMAIVGFLVIKIAKVERKFGDDVLPDKLKFGQSD